MLCAIAVIAVPVSSVCLSLDPRWVLVLDRGDIVVSDPRARCSGAAECLPGCPRTGVVSSSKDRLSGRLLGLPVFFDGRVGSVPGGTILSQVIGFATALAVRADLGGHRCRFGWLAALILLTVP